MLMLQRAAENVNPSECNDPAVLLACSLGSDSCPAACQKDSSSEEDTAQGSTIDGMAIAGDLTLAVADYSSEVRSAPMAGTVVFNAIDFKSSEKVTIESIKLERTGLSSKSDISGVWFEKDGIAVSAKGSLTSDGTVTTRFYNGYSVNGSDTLDLVVELKGTTAGSEIAFKFVDVTSTAKNVSFNATTNTYRTTKYSVAAVLFGQNGGNTTATSYKLGEKTEYEIGKFQISNQNTASEDKDVVLKAIKLKNDGKLDLSSTFKKVYVTRDGKTVSKSVELNSKDMTIYFDDDVLASGKKGIYTIFAEVASLDSTTDSVKLYLNKSSELVANEVSTNFRVTNQTEDPAGSWTLKEYKFTGGKINFTNDSKMAKTVEAAPSATDVEIAKGTLTIAEPIKLEGLSVHGTIATAVNPIKTLKVEIGGSTYTAEDPTVAGSGYTWTFNDEIYVSKTSDFKVLVNIKASWVDKSNTITFDAIRGASFTKWNYETNDEKFTPSEVIAGSIQVAKVIPTAGKFYITNKSSTTQKVVAGNSDEVVIFDGEISTNKDRISVTDLVLTGAYNRGAGSFGLAAGEQISLTVYVDGSSYSDAVFKQAINTAWTLTPVSFTNLWEVTSSTPLKIKVTAQPSIQQVWDITFKVGAKGTDAEGNEAVAVEVSASKLEITAGASATIANATSSSTVEKEGSDALLAQFSATIKNGSYEITGLNIEYTWSSLVGKTIYAEFDGKRISTTDVTTTGIKFVDVYETLEVGKHDFKLLTDINTDNTAGVQLTIQKVGLNAPATQAVNASKYFVKAYPVLSLVSKDTNNNEMTIKISNPENSSEDLIINWLTIDNISGLNTVSLNDQTITAAFTNNTATAIESEHQVTLAPGQSTELRISVKEQTTNSAVSLTAISVSVSWETGADYNITSTYTNVAKWADLKITYKK